MTGVPRAADPRMLQSMGVRRQRLVLDEIGRAVGTRVVYLKSAWSEPVLYGGRGERSGVDVDVLVDAAAFEAFARALVQRGFVRLEHPDHPVSAYAGKDWSFDAPAGYMAVDLHRALAVPPWFDLPGAGPLARAIPYDSVDGPILSLCPEDQVVFFAAHLGTHCLELDDRHLEDVTRLAARFPIDWGVVCARAHQAGLFGALTVCAAALRVRGVALPDTALGPVGRLDWRGRALRWFVEPGSLARRRALPPRLELVTVMPLLSDRRAILPRFLASYAGLRARDWWASRP